MSSDANKNAMKALLRGLSDAEVREMCIEALREWRRKQPGQSQASLHGEMGRELVPMLLRRTTLNFSGAAPSEALSDAVGETGMESIAEFVGWVTRAGLAWPLGAPVNLYPITLHFTRAGLRFLDGTKDHPLVPGFVARVGSRCPSLPDDVTALLVDSRSCLDRGLLRPAIQLMGVGYEVAIEHVVEALIARGVLPKAAIESKAARRISLVKAEVPNVITGTDAAAREERFAVDRAYDFADQLRQRRNDASHTAPRYDFSDGEEAEEFYVSAGRHLPHVWRMHQP